MRFLLATAFLLAASASPFAQELEGRELAIEFRVIDLDFRTIDLVLAGTDVGGGVRDLAVEETATEIRIELSADVLFDFDKSDIKDDAATALGQVASMIRDHPGRPVRIEGHTDSKGSDAYNQQLSEDRALSVKEWLVEEAGLDGAGLETKGLGETVPAVPNEAPDGSDDPDARQKNRRVEIIIGK